MFPKFEAPSTESIVGVIILMNFRDFTVQEDSECQAVNDAAVSSLTLTLTSCVPSFDANKIISRDPVVGRDPSEAFTMMVALLQFKCNTVKAGKRSGRGDDTVSFVEQAELAGSLIRIDESETHADDSVVVDCERTRGE